MILFSIYPKHLPKPWRVSLEFKVQDLWIGAFWQRRSTETFLGLTYVQHLWICILPMLPIHFEWVVDE